MKKQLLKIALALPMALVAAGAWAQPTSPAPAQDKLEENQVIALYSDVYALGASINSYCEGWGQSTALEQKQVGSDNYLYYTNFNWLGWQFSPIVAVSMTHLHVDIWVEGAGSLRIVPIYGGAGLSTDDTHGYVLTLAAGWNQFDLELSTCFSGLDLSSIFQLKFDTGTSVTAFAVDNVYFYTPSTAADEEKPTNLSATLVSTSYYSAVIACKAEDNSGAVTYTIKDGDNTVATGGGASNVAAKVTVSGLTPGKAYTFSVTASDMAGNTTDAVTVQATTVSLPAAAPAPAHKAENVFSIYSDAYTAGTWFGIGGWSQTTIATEANLGENDKAYLLENFNYLGLEMNNNQSIGDLSSMTYLHVDVYPTTETTFQITPIWGNELLHACTPLAANQWNQFDIPLTEFTGINLTNISQIKLAGGIGGTLFVDNLYFWKQDSETVALPSTGSDASAMLLSVQGRQLSVSLREPARIQVFNMLGACLYQADAQHADVQLPAGAYIVRAGNQIQKITVR